MTLIFADMRKRCENTKTVRKCVVAIFFIALPLFLYNLVMSNELAWHYYGKDFYKYVFNARCGLFTYDCSDREVMHERILHIYEKEHGSAAFDSMLATLLRFRTEEGNLLDHNVQDAAVGFVKSYDIKSLYSAVESLKDSMKTLPPDTTWTTCMTKHGLRKCRKSGVLFTRISFRAISPSADTTDTTNHNPGDKTKATKYEMIYEYE